jgi:putative MATE family efflux protein
MQNMGKYQTKRTLYKGILVIALPVMLQNVMSTGLNMIDTVMIGSLGELDVAAVAIANRLVTFFLIVIFGLTSGFSVFMAQYFGAGDEASMKKLLGFDLATTFLISFVFSVVFYAFAPQLIGLFIRDTPSVMQYVVAVGARYLRIIVFSMIVNGMCFSIELLLRSVRMASIPMVSSMFAVLVNVALNYMLIFGQCGFPALGSAGAAYATVIARILQGALTLILIRCARRENNPMRASLAQMRGIDKKTVRHLMRTSAPVLVNETLWSLAQTYFVVIIGTLGAASVAIIQITVTVSNITSALFMGLGSACAVFVGNEIGAGNIDFAVDYAKMFMRIFNVLSILMTGLTIWIRKAIIGLFAVSAQTAGLLDISIVVTAAAMFFGMLNYGYIIGVFRSGADTKFCMYLEIITLWFIGVPATYIGVYVFHAPVYVAAALMQIDNIIKFLICIARFKSLKWINNVVGGA